MAYSYPIGAPAFVPERRDQFARLVREALAVVEEEVLAAMRTAVEQHDPEALLALEEALMRQFPAASGHVVAGVLGFLHRDVHWVSDTVLEARTSAPRPTRSRGWRRTPVRFLGGVHLWIETPYVIEDLRGRPGPTRVSGRRGPSGSGCHPVLEALGIAHRTTPALRSDVARQTMRGSSFEEAHEVGAPTSTPLNLTDENFPHLDVSHVTELMSGRLLRRSRSPPASAATGSCSPLPSTS